MHVRMAFVLPFLALLPACGEEASKTADASGPPKLWELSGFENPESALLDKAAGIVYVSNVAGEPTKKDGNGYISRMNPDGTMRTPKWVQGLDAPKGLAQHGSKLYAADIDQLVEIDIEKSAVVARYRAADAKFLNDVAADAEGNVYVSDMLTNKIWRLSGGTFEVWLNSPDLKNPNGLLVEGDRLIVAAWGVMTDGFSTKVPGNLLAVSLADKKIGPLGDGSPVGNLDGIEPLGDGNYLVSDWMAGKVFKIHASGKADVLLSLKQGTADLDYDQDSKTMYLPLMAEGKVVGYRIE